MRDRDETGIKLKFAPGELGSQSANYALPTHTQYLRQLAFQHMEDGFLIVDAGGAHVDVNQALCEMTGFSSQELIGLRPDQCYWPIEDCEGIANSFANGLHAELADEQLMFVTKQGVRFPVTVTPFAIKDQHGTVIYHAATVKDISQRVKMEAELRDSEDRFRALFEHAGDAILIMENFQIVDCNEQTLQLFKLTREQILTTPTFSFFSPKQLNGQNSRDMFMEKIVASRSGTPQRFEWTGENLDALHINIEVSLSTVVVAEKSYVQIIVRDITKRKQMEKALIELNETLELRIKQRTDELEAAIAELTQRNAQFRALAAQLTEAENDERRRIAQVLHDEHQQLIVAAKFRAEMLQIEATDPSVSDTGRQVVEILDQALESSRTLTMELAPPILYGSGLVVALQWLARWMAEHYALEVTVKGTLPMISIPTDISTLVFQAAREMLLNVVKHSGVKAAGVTVAFTQQQLVVTVTDDGTGFDVAAALESTRSFGLFSIQQRLDMLDGSLAINSTRAHGTEVMLTIPLLSSTAPFQA
jgi:PAS domain S-box-containing protein